MIEDKAIIWVLKVMIDICSDDKHPHPISGDAVKEIILDLATRLIDRVEERVSSNPSNPFYGVIEGYNRVTKAHDEIDNRIAEMTTSKDKYHGKQ